MWVPRVEFEVSTRVSLMQRCRGLTFTTEGDSAALNSCAYLVETGKDHLSRCSPREPLTVHSSLGYVRFDVSPVEGKLQLLGQIVHASIEKNAASTRYFTEDLDVRSDDWAAKALSFDYRNPKTLVLRGKHECCSMSVQVSDFLGL